MKNKFVFKKGEITFGDDEILLNVNSKKELRHAFFTHVSLSIYAASLIYKNIDNTDESMFWIGVFIAIAHLSLFIKAFKKYIDDKVDLADIESIKIESNFSSGFISMKLKDGNYKLLGDVDSTTEINEFITKYKSQKNL